MNSIRKYDNIILFTNGAIGDFLMGALCADDVRKKLGGGEVVVFTPRNSVILQNLFSAYTHVQIYEVNRRNLLCVLILLMRMIRKKNIIVNQGVFYRIPLSAKFLAKALSFHSESTYLHFAEKESPNKNYGRGVTIFDYNISVYENLARLFNTQKLGIPLHVPPYHFISNQSILKRHDLNLSSYVVVHPCAFSPSRSLPKERWAELLSYVTNNFSSIKVVITGSKQDQIFIQKISDSTVTPISFINLAGNLSMMELVNIINGARCFIGVDTGVTHIAGVLQKQSVVIGNLSNPCWLPRYNMNAVILVDRKNCTCDGQKGGDCFYRVAGDKYYRCMLDIPKESIQESIKSILTAKPTL